MAPEPEIPKFPPFPNKLVVETDASLAKVSSAVYEASMCISVSMFVCVCADGM